MTHWIYDSPAPPPDKIDTDPVTDPDTQFGAEDVSAIWQALVDSREAIVEGAVSVKALGAVGDGVVDDTTAIQAAINATAGRVLYFPKGKYKVSSTLTISTRSHALVGEFGNRASLNGTEIMYTGTGPCIQLGTDNGHAWDAADYDGPQDQRIENLWFSHGAPDTPLASAGDLTNRFKSGAFGIWDWRAGQIVLRNVGIENFEANFVGINSDINSFQYVVSLYSKYGLYFGPRSDQARVSHLYSFFCDRAVTIDRAGQTVLLSCITVFCGTDTSSHIEVRRGSHGVLLEGHWFENSGSGFVSGDMQSFVSVGEVDGYGAGGSVSSPGGSPTTTAVAGCAIRDPHCYNLLPGPGHTKYLASVGKCNQFVLDHPTEYAGSGLANFDALVGIQAGQAPTTSDTQIAIYDAADTMTRADMFVNLGGGPVTAHIRAYKKMDSVEIGLDNTAAITLRGAITHAAPSGVNAFTTTNSIAGQTVGTAIWKLLLNGSFDTTAGAIFPVGLLIQALGTRSAGANSVGQTALSIDASGAQTNTAIATARGDNRFNQTSGITEIARSLYLSNEISPASLSSNQTDWSPTGLADAALVIITSSVNVDINSLSLNNNSAGGRDLVLYNGNAAGGANVTLKDEAAALGTASMRFIGRGRADTVLTPGTAARVRYSSSKSRIVVL